MSGKRPQSEPPTPSGADTLPSARGLHVGALSRLFGDATNSHKHLFFAALLEEFRANAFEKRSFLLSTLAIGILAAAWRPCRVHRLSLGVQNQVAKTLEAIDFNAKAPPQPGSAEGELLAKNSRVQGLTRFVPYRLIAPFFASDLRSVSDYRKNNRIRQCANSAFATMRPLYRFVGNDEIELHPDWADRFGLGGAPVDRLPAIAQSAGARGVGKDRAAAEIERR